MSKTKERLVNEVVLDVSNTLKTPVEEMNGDILRRRIALDLRIHKINELQDEVLDIMEKIDGDSDLEVEIDIYTVMDLFYNLLIRERKKAERMKEEIGERVIL